MIALATFSICLAITVILLIIVGLLTGSRFFILFAFLPVLIGESITGQRGTFSPNGSVRRSPWFNAVVLCLVILQVFLLAGILFGIHQAINALTPTEATVIHTPAILTAIEIYQMQAINSILLLMSACFVVLTLLNIIRYWKQIQKMTRMTIFFGYVLPLLMYPFAFVFLYASRNYLQQFENGLQPLAYISIGFAVVYALYLVASKIAQAYQYVTVFRKHQIQLGTGYWLTSIVSIFYAGLFIYFLFRILLSL